ncbi:MAG: YaaR family protein [Defluviitaleaceae bacterium]|nr:YaaR family protein [Defluviitaleaceae bacterium]MCL2836128.1 YaaR family protein [Defluviitaleaceae bacterium]
MDIRIAETTPAFLTDAPVVKDKPISDAFEFTLKRLGDEGLKERLEGLISEIGALGKKLSDHMDVRDMKKYRSLVSDFINEVVTNGHKFERENFLDRRGRHRVYGVVKLVNQHLDDLAKELLKTEKNPLAILEKTGEIHGLLLDLII